ncbi:MAG: peptidylprolyl isomerase [Bacilli bacterium]|nr:peptidylprolyl isomerase [Bacilli bacterium]
MIVVVSLLIIIGLCSTVYFTSSNDDVNDTSSDIADTHEDTSNTTETSLKEDAIYYADIEIKDYGKITVQLDQKSAPITVENFVNLVNDNFYDGLTFHRIIEGFMMQGGDPNGNGTGGSNTNIVGEFSDNGYDNNLSHTRGAISMARSNDYNSASSQFFIVHEDSTYLDGQYAVFGYVTEGLEVVDKVCAEAKPIDNNGTIETAEQPIITSITMREE